MFLSKLFQNISFSHFYSQDHQNPISFPSLKGTPCVFRLLDLILQFRASNNNSNFLPTKFRLSPFCLKLPEGCCILAFQNLISVDIMKELRRRCRFFEMRMKKQVKSENEVPILGKNHKSSCDRFLSQNLNI